LAFKAHHASHAKSAERLCSEEYARKQVGAQTPEISVKCFRTTQKRQQTPDIPQQMFPKLCSFALLKLLLKLCIIALQALIPVD